MANQRVNSLRNQLESAFTRASKIDPQEFELRSDFAKYLCVQVSGFMEYVLYELAMDHCRKRSSPTVMKYVAAKLDRIQNAKSDKIVELLSSFDTDWGIEFERFIVGPKKDALNSVVALRNQIAHGENANITLAGILSYYEQVKLIVNFLTIKFEA